jgi:hypothetical protein
MKNSLELCFVTLLIIVSTTGTAFAEQIQKSFEFGPGTANSTSNKRTFQVPCHAGIEGVSATYQRKGDKGVGNDVPIIMELRSPGATAAEEGPVVDSVALTATLGQKLSITTKLLKGNPSTRGCSLPWIVRVKPASGTSPWVIFGVITLNYFRFDGDVGVEGSLITLNKGNSVTKNVGESSGLHAGSITVTGTWLHSLFGAPGPLPVRLRFQLIDPSGTVVGSKTAYSSAEINPCCSGDKMSFTIPLNQHLSGQWKLRITNNTSDDTMNIDPKIKYKAVCP